MKKNQSKVLAIALAIAGLVCAGPAALAATAVNLGTADNFAVLAGSGITNTGATTVVGDIGTYPTLSETGFGSISLTGTNHAGDTITQGAKTDLTAAYVDAAGQTATSTISADLGGQTLTPGIYNSGSSVGLTGTVTLDGGGDPNAVFIIQAGSTLTTASASHVNLINSAQACNVFWQVGSSATLGTTSDFKGNVLAFGSITDNGGSTVAGRLLARNAAVTLNNTNVAKSVCAGASPATLNVIKHVINNNSGAAAAAAFTINVAGTTNISPSSFAGSETGVAVSLDAGSYSVTETGPAGYSESDSSGCSGTITAGQIKTCTITNDDIPTTSSGGGGGGTYVPPVPPLIDVVKVPNPLNLPDGPGMVTYIYTLRNIGTVPVSNITMIDDSCSPLTRVSGDTNGDSKLDVNETWIYDCSVALAITHTNTVTATGQANGLTATDTASATVVVGAQIEPPLIHVTKIPSPLALFNQGGLITYDEKITNPGTVALSNVTLADDKCSPVMFISGDMNGDSKLDANETWTYLCQARIDSTTTNTAVATGEANGMVARDSATATVVVAAAPRLPNTGIKPGKKGVSWYAVILAGISILSITLLISDRKRKREI